jgi:hypothetical protein
MEIMKNFGPEDLVKAGRIWNNFSLQLQSIINLDADVVNKSLKINAKIKTCRQNISQKHKKKQVIIARKSFVKESNCSIAEESRIINKVVDENASPKSHQIVESNNNSTSLITSEHDKNDEKDSTCKGKEMDDQNKEKSQTNLENDEGILLYKLFCVIYYD